MMPKVEPVRRGDGTILGYQFECPGCENLHWFSTHPKAYPNGMMWSFNGNTYCPTFTPSLLNKTMTRDNKRVLKCCHLFVTEGRIRFLPDCTHTLAGQTVELADIEDFAD